MTDNLLGDLLRRLRKNAQITSQERDVGYTRMTQEMLAARLGWSTAAHISEIENGKRLPTKETIERWIEVCGGGHADLHYALGLAGNLPTTQFPPLSEIVETLDKIIDEWIIPFPVPTYIVDYRNTVWVGNGASMLYFGGYTGLQSLMKYPFCLFHALFDSRVPVYHMFEDLPLQQQQQVQYFKMLNEYRQHEPFYMNFVEDFCATLLPEDAQVFKKVWADCDLNQLDLDTSLFYAKRMTFNIKPDCAVTFSLHDEHIKRFGGLFAVIRQVPDDTIPGNRARIDEAFAPYVTLPPIKFWEVGDAEAYIAEKTAEDAQESK